MDCSICFESFDSNEVTALECSHPFHLTCIKHWVETQRRGRKQPFCPVCKFDVSKQFVKSLLTDASEDVPTTSKRRRRISSRRAVDGVENDVGAAAGAAAVDNPGGGRRRRQRQQSHQQSQRLSPGTESLGFGRIPPQPIRRQVVRVTDWYEELSRRYLNQLREMNRNCPDVHNLVWQNGVCLANRDHTTVSDAEVTSSSVNACLCDQCYALDLYDRARRCIHCQYFIHPPPNPISACALCPDKIARLIRPHPGSILVGRGLRYVWSIALLISMSFVTASGFKYNVSDMVVPVPLALTACVLMFSLHISKFPKIPAQHFVRFHLGFRQNYPCLNDTSVTVRTADEPKLTTTRPVLSTILCILFLIMTFLPFWSANLGPFFLFRYRQSASALAGGVVLPSFLAFLVYQHVSNKKHVLRFKTLLQNMRLVYNSPELYS